MKTEITTVINRPIDEVFEYTTDHVAQWSSIVVESVTLNETPEGVGTTFHVITEENGRRMEFDGVVVEHDPPKLSTVFMKGPMFDVEACYRFDDLGDRTRVTQVSKVTGKGFFRIMIPCMGLFMKKKTRKTGQDEFANLKRLMESRN